MRLPSKTAKDRLARDPRFLWNLLYIMIYAATLAMATPSLSPESNGFPKRDGAGGGPSSRAEAVPMWTGSADLAFMFVLLCFSVVAQDHKTTSVRLSVS